MYDANQSACHTLVFSRLRVKEDHWHHDIFLVQTRVSKIRSYTVLYHPEVHNFSLYRKDSIRIICPNHEQKEEIFIDNHYKTIYGPAWVLQTSKGCLQVRSAREMKTTVISAENCGKVRHSGAAFWFARYSTTLPCANRKHVLHSCMSIWVALHILNDIQYNPRYLTVQPQMNTQTEYPFVYAPYVHWKIGITSECYTCLPWVVFRHACISRS